MAILDLAAISNFKKSNSILSNLAVSAAMTFYACAPETAQQDDFATEYFYFSKNATLHSSELDAVFEALLHTFFDLLLSKA